MSEYSTMSARRYYGPGRTGTVVLKWGWMNLFHGSTADAMEMLKRFRKREKEHK